MRKKSVFAKAGPKLIDDVEAASMARQQGDRHRARALGIVLHPHEPTAGGDLPRRISSLVAGATQYLDHAVLILKGPGAAVAGLGKAATYRQGDLKIVMHSDAGMDLRMHHVHHRVIGKIDDGIRRGGIAERPSTTRHARSQGAAGSIAPAASPRVPASRVPGEIHRPGAPVEGPHRRGARTFATAELTAPCRPRDNFSPTFTKQSLSLLAARWHNL